MTQHRFINDDRSPIPMGGTAEYACVCGKRGKREAIARHIAENSVHDDHDDRDVRDAAPTAPYAQLVDSSASDVGDTQVHYLPMEPREPAPTLFDEEDSITPPELSLPLPPCGAVDALCRRCGTGTPIADLPEITAWSCGHWIHKRPRSIAELFQDMLRSAFQAGAASITTGESFEIWYQREVLQ